MTGSLRLSRTGRFLLGVKLPACSALVLLVAASATALADDSDWKLWIGFLGGVTRWGPLSTHKTEVECRRAIDIMYEIDAKEWLKSKAKGSLDDFEFHVYRCFPGTSPPGPVVGPTTK